MQRHEARRAPRAVRRVLALLACCVIAGAAAARPTPGVVKSCVRGGNALPAGAYWLRHEAHLIAVGIHHQANCRCIQRA